MIVVILSESDDVSPAPARRIAPLMVPEENAPRQSLPVAPIVQDEDGDEAEEVRFDFFLAAS